MVRASELKRAFRAAPDQTLSDLREAFDRKRDGRPGGLSPTEFSLRDLAANFIVDDHGESIGLATLESLCRSDRVLESDAALSTSMFATITREILNAGFTEGYSLPAFVLSGIVPTITGNKEQARLLGVGLPMKDGKSLIVEENEEYPLIGMGEEYVKTPITKKRGAIVAISKETVLADDTGMIVDRARQVGQAIGLEKEIALTDFVIGAGGDIVTEKRIGDDAEVSEELFLEAGDAGRWVNEHDNDLEDWSDIDAAENLFLGMTMPGTGYPPVLIQRNLVAPTQLSSLVSRILTATELRAATATTANTTVFGNPVAQLGIQPTISQLVYTRLVAAGVAAADAAATWFYGDLRRAFRYYQNWDLLVEEDRSREVTFTHDILVRFKASQRGTPVAVEPRLWSRQNPG